MFRYLIYRTDFGNTIVRESLTSSATGGTELEFLTDFVIPINQPLYLWRIIGGPDVAPNTEANINDWLSYSNPLGPDSNITYGILTGYTAQTQISLDGKINILTGATGNVPVLDASGNLVDSGYTPNDFLNGSTGGTSLEIFTGYTATTNTRLIGIEADIVYLSGATDDNSADIIYLSGATDDNSADIVYLSGATDDNSADIVYLSGATDDNSADIIYLSGITAGKQDQLTAGGGISAARLANDMVALDLSAYTAPSNIGISLTGGTFILTDNNPTPRGIQYAANYASTYLDRSLVDKAYVDAIAQGLDPKNSVNVATTVNIDLTGGTFGGVADGITVQNGWRVLVKNQAIPSRNGIYTYSTLTSGFTRATDFDSNAEVTQGAFTTVVSGITQAASSWVLTTPDPIVVGTTPLSFTLLSKPSNYVGGVGITVSGLTIIFNGAAVAGNSLTWNGTTLNVDPTTGTLAAALALKLNTSVFNAYTGATNTRLNEIEADVVYLSGQTASKVSTTTFNGYTGATNTRLNEIEADVIYLSGQTASKVNTTTFNAYTGVTNTRLNEIEADVVYLSGQTSGIEADIVYLSGQTSGNTESIGEIEADIIYLSGQTALKVNKTTFNTFTGTTTANIAYLSGQTALKLDKTVFNTYTGSSKPNEIHLTKTGATDINTVTPTGIVWNSAITTGSSYSWTGGTRIRILEAGTYEVSYNVPFVHVGTNNDRGIGANLILNNATVLNRTASGAMTNRVGLVGSLVLSSVNITFAANDRIDLIAFRTGLAGVSNTAPNASIMIKKKATLQ